MTITERHDMQVDVAIYHVLEQRNKFANQRKVMAFWTRQARRLTDSRLQQIAATLPR
jgi:hypothetical protein